MANLSLCFSLQHIVSGSHFQLIKIATHATFGEGFDWEEMVAGEVPRDVTEKAGDLGS